VLKQVMSEAVDSSRTWVLIFLHSDLDADSN